MDAHHGDRFEAEGLVVRIQGATRVALAPPEHLMWHPGAPAPVHVGTEPWLLNLRASGLFSEGDLLRCTGRWVDGALDVEEVQGVSEVRPARPIALEPESAEEEFDPADFLPFVLRPWTDLERELLDKGVITGRAYMRGDVIRYSGDDVDAIKATLHGVHPRIEVVRCIASPRERELAASIEVIASAAGVLCAIGSCTNLADPSQPSYTYEVAKVDQEMLDILDSLPVGLVQISSHLAPVRSPSLGASGDMSSSF